MISLLLIIVFSILFLMNGVLLGKYYRIHKKAQIINVANEVKKNNYQNIRDIEEKNNLRIEILDEMQLRSTLNRFSSGPFDHFEKNIKVKDLSKDRVILTFQGKGMQNNEMMILLIEKIEKNSFLIVHSPVYAIGEALKVSSNFTIFALIIAVLLSVVVSIIISKKISLTTYFSSYIPLPPDISSNVKDTPEVLSSQLPNLEQCDTVYHNNH